MRPRYRTCWWCSRLFRGNAHRVVDVRGEDVLVHAQCVSPLLVELGADAGMVRCADGCTCKGDRDAR